MHARIEDVMDEAGRWASIEGVLTVGQARRDNEDYIEVRVSCSREDLAAKIPATFKGYRVEIIDMEPPISAQG